MTGQPLRPELDRAWQQYFTQRGGVGPDVPAQVLPVIVIDDNSKGPFPPYRGLYFGGILGALAANFSYAGIKNQDPLLQTKSAVVIDYAVVRNSTAQDDFVCGITDGSQMNLNPYANVGDVSGEKEQPAIFGPVIGNVQGGTLNSAGIFGGIGLHPGGPITQGVRIDGPWVLGPQNIFVVRPLNLAEGIVAFFRGRYYPGS